MTGEELLEAWNNVEVRRFIIDQAMTLPEKDRAEYVAEAWMAIDAGCNCDPDTLYLERMAIRAMVPRRRFLSLLSRGWTQEEVGKEYGIRQQNISKKAKKICKVRKSIVKLGEAGCKK